MAVCRETAGKRKHEDMRRRRMGRRKERLVLYSQKRDVFAGLLFRKVRSCEKGGLTMTDANATLLALLLLSPLIIVFWWLWEDRDG